MGAEYGPSSSRDSLYYMRTVFCFANEQVFKEGEIRYSLVRSNAVYCGTKPGKVGPAWLPMVAKWKKNMALKH